MAFAYPIVLDVAHLPVVIVGGGQVAMRKAQTLLDSGARDIRAVAPTFCQEFPAAVRRIQGLYQPAHLDGAKLVFAATDDALVNEQVVRDARGRGLLVNRADRDAGADGDFSLPAVHRQGGLLVAVASGHSPSLSAQVRDRVAEALDPGWGRLASLSETLRQRVLAIASLSPAARREAFALLASPEAMAVAREHDAEALWAWLCQRHSALGSV